MQDLVLVFGCCCSSLRLETVSPAASLLLETVTPAAGLDNVVDELIVQTFLFLVSSNEEVESCVSCLPFPFSLLLLTSHKTSSAVRETTS